MFQSISSFLHNWNHEAESTQKLLDLLTDQSLSQRVSEDGRSLGFLAWHIVTSVHEMMSRTGLQFDAPAHDAPIPASAADIASGFRQANESFTKALQTQWTDESLQEEHNLYGESWKNGFTLHVLTTHMIHHRGQMTVLMRQAGLKVIGVYGPSREEWSQMGVEAPQ